MRPLTGRIGARPLRKLTAADVRSALAVLSEQLSTRSLQIAHNCLVRAIRHAESNDLVGRNVAALTPARPPVTRGGRRRRCRWIRHRNCCVRPRITSTWTRGRSPSGALLGPGATPRPRSPRRTLRLAQVAVDALRQRRAAQAADRLKVGELWYGTDLAFTTTIGTMLDQHNIRCGFRQITRAAGLGDEWVPRELRDTFVSIIGDAKRGSVGP